MRWLFALILVCISLPTTVHADTIVFQDGTKIDVTKAWEEGGEIKCIIAGVEIGYPKEEVQRVIKKSWSSMPLKCRGLADTKRGIHNGVRITYQMLGFPAQ